MEKNALFDRAITYCITLKINAVVLSFYLTDYRLMEYRL